MGILWWWGLQLGKSVIKFHFRKCREDTAGGRKPSWECSSQPGQLGSLVTFQGPESRRPPGQSIPLVATLAAQSHPVDASIYPGLVKRCGWRLLSFCKHRSPFCLLPFLNREAYPFLGQLAKFPLKFYPVYYQQVKSFLSVPVFLFLVNYSQLYCFGGMVVGFQTSSHSVPLTHFLLSENVLSMMFSVQWLPGRVHNVIVHHCCLVDLSVARLYL